MYNPGYTSRMKISVCVRCTHPLVPQIGTFGSDTPPSRLQLSSADLKSSQLFPLRGIILCYIICTFKGVIVHHLILALWKHMHKHTNTDADLACVRQTQH